MNARGWIAELGKDKFNHKFGGDSWTIVDPDSLQEAPTLLLTFDLADPRLESIDAKDLVEIPLPSYINYDLWIEPQHYKIQPESRHAHLVKRGHSFTTRLEDSRYPTPLPEKPLTLREMDASEYGLDDKDYWAACDTFVGGPSFIRVLGKPLWLQNAIDSVCLCGVPQAFICSIGYDVAKPSQLIDEGHFFVGEAGLYFFLCCHCLIVSVISQPT
jgi:hypothetical protein